MQAEAAGAPAPVQQGGTWMGAQLSARARALLPVMRWYAHAELPRYGYLLDWWGMNHQPRWNAAGLIETKGRFHGYQMRLELADFFQRIDYFFASYHELDVVGALDACLRSGEAFLDGGANIGLVTLHAAWLVGPSGLVDAVECSPRVYERLSWHAQRNSLKQVRCHRLALSDQPGELHVKLPGFDNNAAATLGPIPDRYGGDIQDLGVVQVVRGDDLIDPADQRPMMIKLDVEGFELHALHGLERTIASRRPAIVMEVNGEMLTINGASPEKIFDFLHQWGYVPWALDRGGFRERHRLKLHPLTREQLQWEKDVMFITPEGVHWSRVDKLFQRPGQYWRHHRIAEAQRAAAGH